MIGKDGAWHPGAVLSQMRDKQGRPNLGVRALAVLVALLLAGPLTLLVIDVVQRVLDLAL
jgi:hypothetical protein